jgi:CheY-like chemotaxis protein
VQKLVEMHGGRVEAQSEGVNLGSAFLLRFPTVAPPQGSNGKTPVAQANGKARRVLIVDDNRDTAQGMARLLTRAGHKVELAHDGVEALERAREAQPEAVVLDIGLPGMDGFEVARRLREEPSCAQTIIIAVTGYGQPEDRRRALEAGCHHHLVKPVDIEEIKRLLGAPVVKLS